LCHLKNCNTGLNNLYPQSAAANPHTCFFKSADNSK
jgi:hypothetical protein